MPRDPQESISEAREQVSGGHSSITVTMDTYGHLMPEIDESLAHMLDARLRDARQTTLNVQAEA